MKFVKQLSISIKEDGIKETIGLKLVPLKMVLVVFFVLVCCMHNMQAQNLNLETLGVKGGINTFNITGSYAGNTGALLGFHLGAFAELKLHTNLSINPELLFALNHWDGPNRSNDITIYWTNLDLPVIAKVRLDQITEGLSLQAGPQIGILLAAKHKGTASDGSKFNEDRSDDVKSSNLSFGVGAGYELSSGIQFTIRYLIGLSQVGQDEEGDFLSDVKTRSLQISAAYPIFKK